MTDQPHSQSAPGGEYALGDARDVLTDEQLSRRRPHDPEWWEGTEPLDEYEGIVDMCPHGVKLNKFCMECEDIFRMLDRSQ